MLKNIKNVFSDVFLLYKNFFSWFIVKLSSFVMGIVLGLIFVFPSWLVGMIYSWYYQIETFTNWEFGNDLFLNIILLFLFISFALGFLYNYIFLGKYNLKLINERKKVKFKLFKNFFNIKNIKRFLALTLINSAIILFLIVGFVILFNLIKDNLGFTKSLNIAYSSIFNIFGIILLLSILIIFYIFYRIIFSYAFMVDKKISAYESFKESVDLTSGFKKFVRTLVIGLIFLTIYLPFHSLEKNLEKDRVSLSYYGSLIKISKEKEIPGELQSFYNAMQLKYNGKSINDIYILYKTLGYIKIFITILMFFLFFGAGNMVYMSIYNNVIKK